MSSKEFFHTKEELLELLNQGLSRKAIAEMLSVSTATITNYMKKYEIYHKYDMSRIKITKEQLEECLKEKMTREQVSRKLKCNISTIQKFCDEYQIYFPRVEFDKSEYMRRAALNSYKVGAKSRGLEFSLSEEYFYETIVKPCIYCGSEKKNVKQQTSYIRSTKLPFYYTGIDRVDSKIGYTVENSVPCCSICNRAKKNMPEEEFREWINNLVNFYKNKENDN